MAAGGQARIEVAQGEAKPRSSVGVALAPRGKGFGVCSNSNWDTSEHFKPEADVMNLCVKEVIHGGMEGIGRDIIGSQVTNYVTYGKKP